ncbi:glycosyl-4,4'-diaponeurosporenoate acyltransferase CrtO family protein [Chitinophaga agri]|uniref:glycosyl-4,4'-diaponeurosporenoate acyltransferase CrtO family protein n=1 Tax=Chitinophaga agri TaxID=2703787 RepID=UPI003744279E
MENHIPDRYTAGYRWPAGRYRNGTSWHGKRLIFRHRSYGLKVFHSRKSNKVVICAPLCLMPAPHYGLLLVMLLLTGHALSYQWRWMPVMIVCNVIFNAYPVLLQQYVRIRLRRML